MHIFGTTEVAIEVAIEVAVEAVAMEAEIASETGVDTDDTIGQTLIIDRTRTDKTLARRSLVAPIRS